MVLDIAWKSEVLILDLAYQTNKTLPMKVFTSKLLAELEEHLNEINLHKEDTIQSAEDAINVTIIILEKLKTFSISHTFENKGDEINFFKIIKPQFVSRLIYYNEIHNIESNKEHIICQPIL